MARTASALALCAAALLALPSRGAVKSKLHVRYDTQGAWATYADGVTPILEGERFVLVWTAAGTTIDPAKDITGDVNSFLGDNMAWLSLTASKNGLCPEDEPQVDDARYKTGTLRLYLLDTRISPTELAPLGTNRNGDSFPTVVKAVALVPGVSYDCSKEWRKTIPDLVTGSAPATSAWTILPKKTPTPVVVSMICTNGVATVGVTNTVSTATYDLKGSLDLTFTNVVWSCASKAGLSDPNAVLSFDDANATNSAAFYRIEVKK